MTCFSLSKYPFGDLSGNSSENHRKKIGAFSPLSLRFHASSLAFASNASA